MPVKVIESYAQFQEIINGDRPAVIDFWATWCGPCKAISPIFAAASDKEENAGIDFYKVDVDDQEQISQEVGIKAMPTFTAFHKGNKVKEVVGARPPLIQELLSETNKLI